jgi:hypothetical protein
MDTLELITLCRGMGAVLIPMNDKLKIKAPQPLPENILTALSQEKPRVIAELRYQLQQESECWFLAEWRRISIPDWRRILLESINAKDIKREEYSRWMLKEVLEDPEYKEQSHD